MHCTFQIFRVSLSLSLLGSTCVWIRFVIFITYIPLPYFPHGTLSLFDWYIVPCKFSDNSTYWLMNNNIIMMLINRNWFLVDKTTTLIYFHYFARANAIWLSVFVHCVHAQWERDINVERVSANAWKFSALEPNRRREKTKSIQSVRGHDSIAISFMTESNQREVRQPTCYSFAELKRTWVSDLTALSVIKSDWKCIPNLEIEEKRIFIINRDGFLMKRLPSGTGMRLCCELWGVEQICATCNANKLDQLHYLFEQSMVDENVFRIIISFDTRSRTLHIQTCRNICVWCMCCAHTNLYSFLSAQ